MYKHLHNTGLTEICELLHQKNPKNVATAKTINKAPPMYPTWKQDKSFRFMKILIMLINYYWTLTNFSEIYLARNAPPTIARDVATKCPTMAPLATPHGDY